jgi:uncharacterized membrane protein
MRGNTQNKPLLSASKLSALRWLSLGCYFGLMVLVLSWNTLISPSQHYPTGMILLLTALPLLFPLWGMLNGKAYTHAWVSFLATYYFFLGVGDAYSDPLDRVYGVLMVVLSVGLFFGSMYYARFKGREDKSKQPVETED